MSDLKVTSSELTSAAEQMLRPRPKGPDSEAAPDYGLKAPDTLPETNEALNQLKHSAGILSATLKAGDAEVERLAATLKSVAAAYDKIDEQAKARMQTEVTGDDGSKPPLEPVVPEAVNIAVPSIPDLGSYPSSPDDQFQSWQASAHAIFDNDTKALSLNYFRDQWKAYKGTLLAYADNIPAKVGDWDGTAAKACQNAMQSLHTWWKDMAEECGRLAEEAQKFCDAHDQLVRVHPNLHDVAEYEKTNRANKMRLWAQWQYQSEYDRNNYENNINLQQIRPGKAPTIGGMPAVNSNEVGSKPETPGVPGTNPGTSPGTSPGTNGDVGTAQTPSVPSMDTPSMSPASADPSAGQGSGGSPSGGSPSGGQGGGQPSGGSPSGGAPSGGLPTGTEGMPEMPGLEEPSLKPASAGGGGGGMGGRSGARAGAGPAGVPGGAGAGGMGGGMGGMGGGHGQGGQGKEKRRNPNLTEDEDLYVEDRAYTEAVIGRRARKDAKDGK
ncbi:PPE domain-containing protein [Mycolicibacterium neworleansense]|uniref:Antigen MTB48 n=1 Tax=Mycolicibacterium neworleansense TaxID=146018 RepID=A0A0H5RUE3_9MYCO|nr:hypothetical protein [Mycolicibacterium neworleansense]CRZ17167.1 antigen MTB48 [Mycolicibacterium neworleansense]